MKRGENSCVNTLCSQWCSASVLGLPIDDRGPKASPVELHTGSSCGLGGSSVLDKCCGQLAVLVGLSSVCIQVCTCSF